MFRWRKRKLSMNVLLLEDHPIFVLGVRQLILQRWPQAVCVEKSTLSDALSAVREGDWSIVVADLNLPDAEGVEVISKLLRAKPGLKLLVLSFNAESAYARRALQLGACGYVAKDQASIELVSAIERVTSGGRYISTILADQLVDLATGRSHTLVHESLSAQEYRVMLSLAAGQRVGDLANSMHLSPKTVSTYRRRILEKLELSSNAELARYCIAHGLLKDDV